MDKGKENKNNKQERHRINTGMINKCIKGKGN